MRWPGSWKSPAAMGLLKRTPVNWLLVDKGTGGVLMDDKNETVRVMSKARFRFGRFLKLPFGCVFS